MRRRPQFSAGTKVCFRRKEKVCLHDALSRDHAHELAKKDNRLPGMFPETVTIYLMLSLADPRIVNTSLLALTLQNAR